jgi:hypothetical protein
MGSMTRDNGVVRGFGRRGGSAGFAGYLVLRSAWQGSDRPSLARLVTAAMRISAASQPHAGTDVGRGAAGDCRGITGQQKDGEGVTA